jgi:hypothetical protein
VNPHIQLVAREPECHDGSNDIDPTLVGMHDPIEAVSISSETPTNVFTAGRSVQTPWNCTLSNDSFRWGAMFGGANVQLT